MIFLFSFYLHFRYPIRFTFTFQIMYDLTLHLLLYLVFVILHLLSLLLLLFSAKSFEPKMYGKGRQFHSFFALDIWKHAFFHIIIFYGNMFKFYLVAVFLSICIFKYIAERRISLEQCDGCLCWPKQLLVALNLSCICIYAYIYRVSE